MIEIAGKVEDGRVIYSVQDNGIGIAPEHQPRVFEIFHRLDPDATVGEGLGLTIAQRILERQDGKLWVESEAGRGSCFFVSLPMAPQP
jgi:signal transduction histidine kinase